MAEKRTFLGSLLATLIGAGIVAGAGFGVCSILQAKDAE